MTSPLSEIEAMKQRADAMLDTIPEQWQSGGACDLARDVLALAKALADERAKVIEECAKLAESTKGYPTPVSQAIRALLTPATAKET